MSAALSLPFLWAAASVPAGTRDMRPRPLGGLAFYRKRTERLLRRYMRMSLDMGRMPSIVGNIVFRGRATCYRLKNFEDAVIFVIDVERCLKKLDSASQQLIVRIALQEYTQGEAAELTQQSLRSVQRHYGEALDRLTQILLHAGLLVADAPDACQESC
ncbi:hypothetical protein [Silvibacterium acidisoli]|uniref:hypothetical protein n=1 Tax=Acidobacteriaceae bacterium ZG23-2 TaxID=2883246 RepID=UPI00406C83A0